MLKKRDGYVMIYVMIVMLILGLVAGNALAAASHNATSEVNAVRQMKERYTAEGALNRRIAELEVTPESALILDRYAFSYHSEEEIPETGEGSVPKQKEKIANDALHDVLEKYDGYTLESLKHDSGKIEAVFRLVVSEGSTTISIKVLAVFSFQKEIITDNIRYKLTNVTCNIESFEITQS
ncbi:MAG: hypothetical protein E7423_00675 [Ruminococcaceae bacterium]|jgi:hypothetical protein|nr:hypothetical protein [Oscillospiraceae bacterium]